jgi:hypothetical protein
MKIPLSLLGIALLIGLVYYLQRHSFSKNEFREVLEVIRTEVNKTCPKMEDADTRLDSTTVPTDKSFQYHYTLVDLLKDSMDVELFHYSLQPSMVYNIKTNPDLDLFRKNNITLVYNFKDKAGDFVTKIVVGPDKYR